MLAEREMTWIDWARLEGEQKGRQEGEQDGERKGEATMLQLLLESRFGPLNEAALQQIADADSDTLLQWGKRVLTAQRLEDVLT